MPEFSSMIATQLQDTTHIGWWWERLNYFIMFFIVLETAILRPGNLMHLSAWAIIVHTLYFSLDKSSKRPAVFVRLLHCISLQLSLSTFLDFIYLFTFCSAPYNFSLVKWYHAIDGTSTLRGTVACYAEAFGYHVWPPIALFVDLRWNWIQLCHNYEGSGCFVGIWFVIGMIVFANIWQTIMRDGGGKDIIDLYACPRAELESWSTAFAGLMGITRADLESRRFGIGTEFAFVNICKGPLQIPVWCTYCWLIPRMVCVSSSLGKRH